MHNRGPVREGILDRTLQRGLMREGLLEEGLGSVNKSGPFRGRVRKC
jgi:hypothetical protein